jgi:orotidine-5'-phosphate decarboxylase
LLKDRVGLFKVGKEAFTRFGPEIVHRIQSRGGEVFLDLKFHDIPRTTARAASVACDLGVLMFNIHALGGEQMIRETVAAVAGRGEQAGRLSPYVLAVTVLTSLNDQGVRQLGFGQSAAELTIRLARLAKECGASGVVASPEDITPIRQACGEDFLIVTPGIRSAARQTGDDQKRVLGAEEAIRRGADYLVIGRPIAAAPDPRSAAESFVASIAAGLKQR